MPARHFAYRTLISPLCTNLVCTTKCLTLSHNPLPATGDRPTDLLPEYFVIGSLDMRALPPVLISDRSHVRQLQLDDAVTGQFLRNIEVNSQPGLDEGNISHYVVHDITETFNLNALFTH